MYFDTKILFVFIACMFIANVYRIYVSKNKGSHTKYCNNIKSIKIVRSIFK